MENMEPHVVMVTIPLLGHIYPLLHFAKALVTRLDFTVTFVSNHFYHHHILAQESLSSSSAINGKLRFEWVEDGLPLDCDVNGMLLRRPAEFRQVCSNMQAPFKALLESLKQKQPPVSCAVIGSFFLWGYEAAAQLGIRSIFFWSQSAAVFSIYRHMPLLYANGFFPCKKAPTECKEDDARLLSYIPGVSPLYPEDLPTFLQVEDLTDLGLKTMEQQFDLLKECHAVLINSFHELEKQAFEALQGESLSIFAVGPLLSPKQAHTSSNEVANAAQVSLKDVDKDDCLKWLDKRSMHSVLYISFGTISNPAPESMKGIALALRETKQPFVWAAKLRPYYNHLSNTLTEFRSVAEMFPEGFLEGTRDYGIVISWAPQQEVLGHPSVGAFLTHCGWNSTLESLSMGVPMIALPNFSDQTTNAKYVTDVWKVGKRLNFNESTGSFDFADLMRVLRVIFHEEEGQKMRKRAGKLKEAARRASESESETESETATSSKNDINKFSQALMCPTAQRRT